MAQESLKINPGDQKCWAALGTHQSFFPGFHHPPVIYDTTTKKEERPYGTPRTSPCFMFHTMFFVSYFTLLKI